LVGESSVLLGSAFLAQKLKGDITLQSDAIRESFFQELFGINKWAGLFPLVKEQYDYWGKAIAEASQKMTFIRDEGYLDPIDKEALVIRESALKENEAEQEKVQEQISGVEREIFELERTIKEKAANENKRAAKKRQAEKISQDVARNIEIIKEYSKDRNKLRLLNFEVDRLVKNFADKAALQKEIEEGKKVLYKVDVLNHEIKAKEKEIERLRKEISQIETSGCKGQIECNFISGALKAKKRIPALEQEIIEKQIELGTYKDREIELHYKEKELAELLAFENDLHKKRTDIAVMQERLKQIPILCKIVQDKKAEMKSLKEEIALIVVLSSSKEREAKFELDKKKDALKLKRNIANKAARDASNEIAKMLETEKKAEAKKVEYYDLKHKYDEAAKNRDNYAILAKAIDRQGVPHYLMKHSIPHIQEIIDKIMDGVSHDFAIHVSSTDVNVKTGATKEGFFIKCEDYHGVRDIDDFSPGQSNFTRIILRLAIVIYNSQKAGNHYRIFIADEPFDALERDNALKLVGIIKNISQYFKQVIIISHNDVFLNQFIHKIELRRDGDKVEATIC
jgi:DNA repair exonuclease SbcCD ATPase subunit